MSVSSEPACRAAGICTISLDCPVGLQPKGIPIKILRVSVRDQDEGGELDSREEVRHFCGSRRDQEEGGGAGLFFTFLCTSAALFSHG